MAYQAGRHFLQIPGPTNVPDRVLHAIEYPTIDHRSANAASLALACFEGLKAVFKTREEVVIFPSSGTGAWEAALVNTLNPGDRVLAFEPRPGRRSDSRRLAAGRERGGIGRAAS
jgi:alanine-glyoxylate transaminase/serine-glyoxylate transaminase/serine-pyruvate transaminase